ncbi:parallel beta-helix repeat (two copies) [Actinopolymorpha cephalotaxi]|uniref:Parallel beta-helix repeat (Two copies) n=1 Tax=Actinopolymorpha cephalotaxi TaxID=504797 RepID=A0A1I2T529_9ACTN|nr:right-handed parallel beta-helix repeat-containing protein [Actinopolymorpha cephalotaxi]NYH82943.1 parallel beta-helix repeat protein [Actinopolymorpha cephalotaxi]SFG60165.1 parallel beta-helix repeat (two copies) [Actinopolymorpha cephalotaxi]
MPASRHVVVAVGAALLLATANALSASAATPLVEPEPGMVITHDTTFKPGVYDFTSGKGIVIGADDVRVNATGVTLRGPGQKGKPDSFTGTGVAATGVSGATLTGLSVSGFETALHVSSGRDWTIRGNTFSGNYTDPDYGWGDGKLAGAVLLEHVSGSRIEDNTAHENWNGLALHYADDNLVRRNDFSHCSNVCLKMWSASRNRIEDNNFSWGIRIAPGETHARDSTSALIETGSNDNRVLRNDFTYGGDGVFLRPLNGVVSTGNYFEGNDASWAHNNAWESWSPGNTYVRNKGNHASYGFWLGASDDTVLIGNEAAFNGRDNKNAPEPFGNAGIAVVNGSSSNFVLDGNHVHDNTSAGVAIGYLPDYPAYHWVIQRNRIENNTTYGIYMRDARWLTLANNTISGNGAGAIKQDKHVSGVFTLDGAASANAPVAKAAMTPSIVHAGDAVTFDASGSTDADGGKLSYRWEFGDGDVATDATVTHRFLDPGFHRVGLTVDDGGLAGLDHRDVYVLAPGVEQGTDAADRGDWSARITSDDAGDPGTTATVTADPTRALLGRSSIKLSGTAHDVTWRYQPRRAVDTAAADQLEFWMASEQETRDGFDGNQPTIRLVQDAGNYVDYTPAKNYLSPWSLDYSEARGGWQRVVVPLAGDKAWTRKVTGNPDLKALHAVEVRTSAVGGPYRVWLDALAFTKAPVTPDVAPDLALNPAAQGDPSPLASTGDDTSRWAPLDGKTDGAVWSTAGSQNATDFYGADFGVARTVDALRLDLSSGDGYAAPAKTTVEYWTGDAWQPVDNARPSPASPATGHNEIAFDPVTTQRLRVVLGSPGGGKAVGLAEFAPVSTGNLAGNALGASAPFGTPVASGSAGSGDPWSLVDGSVRADSAWRSAAGTSPWVAVDLMRARPVNTVTLYAGSADTAPAGVRVQAWTGSDWLDVSNTTVTPAPPAAGRTTVRFDTVKTRKLRLVLEAPAGGTVEVREVEVRNANLLSDASALGLTVTPTASYTYPGDTVLGPLDGSYAASPRWTSWNSKNVQDWYAVRFDRAVTASRITLHFYNDNGGVKPPKDYTIEYWNGSGWTPVQETGRSPAQPAEGFNAVDFTPVRAAGFRLVGTNQNPVNYGVYIGLTELELWAP